MKNAAVSSFQEHGVPLPRLAQLIRLAARQMTTNGAPTTTRNPLMMNASPRKDSAVKLH